MSWDWRLALRKRLEPKVWIVTAVAKHLDLLSSNHLCVVQWFEDGSIKSAKSREF